MLACGLWMRAGYVGASLTLIGAVQIVDGEWSLLLALATAAAGIALAILSWHRAHAALRNVDEPITTARASPAPRRVRTALGV